MDAYKVKYFVEVEVEVVAENLEEATMAAKEILDVTIDNMITGEVKVTDSFETDVIRQGDEIF